MKQKGVTLIELTIIMIAFSIVAVPLSNGFISVSNTILLNSEVNQANNLTRACAEHVLYKRRAGTTTFTATDCNGITGFLGTALLSVVTSDSTSNAPLCPAPATGTTNCHELTITANNPSGQARSALSLFFIYNP